MTRSYFSLFAIVLSVFSNRVAAEATVLAATREFIPALVQWGPARMQSRCGDDLYVLESADYFQVWTCVRWDPQAGKFITKSAGLVDSPNAGEMRATFLIVAPEFGSSRFILGRNSQFYRHDANDSSEELLAVLQNPSLTDVVGLGTFDFNGDGRDDALLSEGLQFRDITTGERLGRLASMSYGPVLIGEFSEKPDKEALVLEQSLVRVLQPRTGLQLTLPTQLRVVPPMGSFNTGDNIDQAFAVNLVERNQLLLMNFKGSNIQFRAVSGTSDVVGAIPVRWRGFQTPLIFTLRADRLDLIDPDSASVVLSVPGERRAEVGRRFRRPVDLDNDGDEEVIFSARGNDYEVFRNPDGARFLHEAYQSHVPLAVEVGPSGNKQLLTIDSGSTVSPILASQLPPRFSRFGIDTLNRIETGVPLGSTNFVRDVTSSPGSERISLGSQGKRELNSYAGETIWSLPESANIPPDARWLVGRALPNARAECEGIALVDRFGGFTGVRTVNLLSGELSERRFLSDLQDARSFAFADLNQDGICDISILFFGALVTWDGRTLTKNPQVLWRLNGLNYAHRIAASALNPTRPVIVVFGTSQLPPSTLIVDGRNGAVQRTVAVNSDVLPTFDRDILPIAFSAGNRAWVWTTRNRVVFVDEMMRAPVEAIDQPGYSGLLGAGLDEFYVGGLILRKIRIRLDLIHYSGFDD